MFKHDVHSTHTHQHGPQCGHPQVQHDGHTDYLHDGHLHFLHGSHYDEHVIAVTGSNPADCKKTSCSCPHDSTCGHPQIPHGDHFDYLFEGSLHHRHEGHCDDHGPLRTV